MLHIDLRGDEIVRVHIRCVIRQLAETMECADDSHWYHSLQYGFQSQSCEGVRLNNRYFGFIAHVLKVIVGNLFYQSRHHR